MATTKKQPVQNKTNGNRKNGNGDGKKPAAINQEVVQPEFKQRTGTKMEIAKRVFIDGRKNGQSRKRIIERFISEARLTRNGSSTYYQLLKRKHEEGTL